MFCKPYRGLFFTDANVNTIREGERMSKKVGEALRWDEENRTTEVNFFAWSPGVPSNKIDLGKQWDEEKRREHGSRFLVFHFLYFTARKSAFEGVSSILIYSLIHSTAIFLSRELSPECGFSSLEGLTRNAIPWMERKKHHQENNRITGTKLLKSLATSEFSQGKLG